MSFVIRSDVRMPRMDECMIAESAIQPSQPVSDSDSSGDDRGVLAFADHSFLTPDQSLGSFDVIVIGSGAGGSLMARQCLHAGKRVLLIERGRIRHSPIPRDENSTLFERLPYEDRSVRVNGSDQRMYIGGNAGGSTAVYGAALLRPSLDDFQPGRHYGDRLERSRWEWPIGYSDLEPHYSVAESLFRVSRNESDAFGPLQPPSSTLTGEPIPWAPINERLVASSQSAGWKPFRLPLGINGSTCLRCSNCAGFVCPNGSRRSSVDLLSEVNQGVGTLSGTLKILENTEVRRLETRADGSIAGLQARCRDSGRDLRISAKAYVLAAGALGSSAILLRSRVGGPLVGRGYMFHYSPVAIGIFAKPTDADRTFVKQVGFADHYFGTPDCSEKTGIIQSLPAPGTLMMKKNAPRIPRPIIKTLRRRMLPLVGIVEDLPDPNNRIQLDGERISLRHRFNAFDRARGRSLVKQMVRILKRAGAVHCVVHGAVSNEHVAHQCGTTPMASNPEDGVVDRDCRVFDAPNLFIVDGGVLPSSLGVGPALTIMANSLRVSERVVAEC